MRNYGGYTMKDVLDESISTTLVMMEFINEEKKQEAAIHKKSRKH